MPLSATRPHDPDAMSAAAGSMRSTWLKDLTVLAVVSLIWFCALMGVRPLRNPDEGRYTEIPREMAATGDYVTPRLNGVQYFEKPPLVYWVSALTFRVFGINEFTARLWTGIFAATGVLLTYIAARVLHDRATGIWSAVVLATSLLYYALSQIILTDMAVAVTMSGALFTFILAVREPRGRKRLGLFLVFYLFIALATLSKGLIGIALPGAVIFLWVLLLNRWRMLWPFYPILGTLLLLAIAAPWHVLAARANPDFLNFYFVHEHWQRFTTRDHNRYQPWWFFLPVLTCGLFPWVVFGWQSLIDYFTGGWKARKEHEVGWFLLIWVVFIMLFFSKSQSKLVPYVLPVFPAAAVLIGHQVSGIWLGLAGRRFRTAGWIFIGLSLVTTVVIFTTKAPKSYPDLHLHLKMLKLTLGIPLLLGAGLAFLGLRRNQPRLMLAALTGSSALFLIAANCGGGAIDNQSTKEFAMILKPMLKADDRVYCVGLYAQDLPPYLDRQISVVDFIGELEYGIKAEPEKTASRFLKLDDLAAQWSQPAGAYALVRRKLYDKWFATSGMPHEVIRKTELLVLVAKSPAPAQP